MSEVTIGLMALFVLLLLFLTGIELAFCMTIVGFVGFAYLVTFPAACNLLVKDFFDTFTSLQLYGDTSFCAYGPDCVQYEYRKTALYGIT